MGQGLAIGLGGGLVACVAIVFAFFALLRTANKHTERANDRADASDKRVAETEQKLATALEDIGELEKHALVYENNQRELKRELDAKDTNLRELNARLEAVEKARVNLAAVLKSDPRLVSAVVSAAFDGLRDEVSRAQAAATAAAARDPNGGSAGAVHGSVQAGERP